VLRTGRRRRAGGVEVVRAPGIDGKVRVGLVAGKKVGTAVLRNRIRRRLRRAVPEAALTSGYDYVIIGDRRVADTSFQELVGWIREAGQ